MFVSTITPDEIHIVIGGGEAPQMGQCVLISSRSSAGEPMITKPIRFPKPAPASSTSAPEKKETP
jgi:hypothetical protein